MGTVDARLKTAPDNDDLHLIRGQILALLGRNAESAREAKIVDELPTGAPSPAWANSSVLIHAALGDADTAMPMLEQLLMRDRKTNVGWPLTPALLRIDPRWEKLRGNPRFQKLIVDGEARLSAAKVERDWPREPDLKRAMDLVNSYEAITEDYALAEDLALAKVEAKLSDPEAVTVMARVQSQILLRGFDRSDERYAKAKRYAERAQQLAPDEPEAPMLLRSVWTFEAVRRTA